MPEPGFEEYKLEIVSDKKKADALYSILVNSEVEELFMPPIPLSAMKDFFDDKRSNMWEITMNGVTYLTVMADRDTTMALIKMVKDAGEEKFMMAPLPVSNLRDFVNGQRDNVAKMTMRKNLSVQVRVKPDKGKKEKEKDKETS